MKLKILHQKHLYLFEISKIFLFAAILSIPATLPPAALSQVPVSIEKQIVGDSGNYKIGIGDMLKIVILKQDLLSQDNVRVGNEGTIRMPMIEEPIQASCLTESELSSVLVEKYRKYLLNPQVYVSVKEFDGNPVAVIGAVKTPGRFQLKRPIRLMELLTFVNGPTATASKDIQIFRTGPRCSATPIETLGSPSIDVAGQGLISLQLADVLSGKDGSNPFIQAGDIIRLPEAEVKQAFVIGNVKSAAIVNLKEPITLTRALAMAGGVSPGAEIEKIKISRQGADGVSKSEIVVNLKEISKNNKEDMMLQPNDIVDVPGKSGIRKVLPSLLRAAVPTLLRVPIIVP